MHNICVLNRINFITIGVIILVSLCTGCAGKANYCGVEYCGSDIPVALAEPVQ